MTVRLISPATPPALWTPDTLGYLGMTYDPMQASGSLAAFVASGVVSLFRVNTPKPLTVTNIATIVGAANITPVGSQNFAGIYDSTGSRLGVTADQSVAWGSTGLVTMAISGGPISVPGVGGFAWIAILQNAATLAGWAGAVVGSSAAQINTGLTAASARYGSILTGQTTLPGSITPGSITLQSRPYWGAFS